MDGKALFALARLSPGRDAYDKAELAIVVDKLQAAGMKVGDALNLASALEEVLGEEAVLGRGWGGDSEEEQEGCADAGECSSALSALLGTRARHWWWVLYF